MSIILFNIAMVLLSYVFGSISSAIIVCRLAGLKDPRTTGSSNPGATNVLRIGGKKYAIFTLIGDIFKGFLPVSLAVYAGFSDWLLALIMVAAFIGHLFPVFFEFKGGKGIATAFGVLFALNVLLGLMVLVVWILTAVIFRYSSLAGLVAFASAPFFIKFYFNYPDTLFLSLLLIAVFIIFRHSKNIKQLVNGVENKIGKK